jgi:acylpyruvate hydrolase
VRLVSFKTEPDAPLRCGIQADGKIADASAVAALAGLEPASIVAGWSARAITALDTEALGHLAQTVRDRASELADQGALLAADDVALGPPVPEPQKIICLGLNYGDHAREAGLTPPSVPMFFAKYANSLIGPFDAIVPPPTTDQVDYEAELAVVIGRKGRHVSADDALQHVFGVMAFNDVSARDLQLANNLWTGGKAIDTFGPCGPALVTLDEVGDIGALGVRTRVNGETVQNGNTADMIFGVAKTIAFLSSIMTLEPGDIIATGTPAGVGNARDPKLFLSTGDVVEVEIDGIGLLKNPVADPA